MNRVAVPALALLLSGCTVLGAFGGVFIHAAINDARTPVFTPAPPTPTRPPRPVITDSDRARCEEKRTTISAAAAIAPSSDERLRILDRMPNCLDPYWETPEVVLAPAAPPPRPARPKRSERAGLIIGALVGLAVDIGVLYWANNVEDEDPFQ